ncbi:MAG: tRNA (guanosine(37)-N1)-methyltransferase TrmD [Rickettsiales bacterium]|jgi:tRNA (guanine37-N1)-methyltransferase|nr:tRNA (guanosine(37)-N1)-methyltransferase TrmD [Rickettsiales bacterium]
MKHWHVSLLTIFPEMFPGPLAHSIAGKALENKLFTLDLYNIRDYALDKHQSVDDKIFGGGAGMLMKPDVISGAIDAALEKTPNAKLIYFSPRGEKFTQESAKKLVSIEDIIMLCGRYEGIDQRVFKKYNFEEYSIGDYILSGGEMAALTVIDSCIRLIPGVIDNEEVNSEESFSIGEDENLLEYDQYTRPSVWQGMKVPEVLLSGHHENITKWRLENARENTKNRRPDLYKK